MVPKVSRLRAVPNLPSQPMLGKAVPPFDEQREHIYLGKTYQLGRLTHGSEAS